MSTWPRGIGALVGSALLAWAVGALAPSLWQHASTKVGLAPAPAAEPKSGWLGLVHATCDADQAAEVGLPEPRGVYVKGVAEDGPAARTGVLAGDVILAWGGTPITSSAGMVELLGAAHAGDTIELKIWRKGAETTSTVTLGEKPGA